MERLRDLAGSDLDAGRRAELVLPEYLVEHREDQRMRCRGVERPVFANNAYTRRVRCPRSRRDRAGVIEDGHELDPCVSDGLDVEQPLDQGVPVALEVRDDRLDRSSVPAPATLPSNPLRNVAKPNAAMVRVPRVGAIA